MTLSEQKNYINPDKLYVFSQRLGFMPSHQGRGHKMTSNIPYLGSTDSMYANYVNRNIESDDFESRSTIQCTKNMQQWNQNWLRFQGLLLPSLWKFLFLPFWYLHSHGVQDIGSGASPSPLWLVRLQQVLDQVEVHIHRLQLRLLPLFPAHLRKLLPSLFCLVLRELH